MIDGLEVVVLSAAETMDDAGVEVAWLGAETGDTADRLDVAEASAAALMKTFGIEGDAAAGAIQGPVRRDRAAVHVPTWAETVERARANLTERGIDADDQLVESLLDPAEVQRIQRRFTSSCSLRARLDFIDVVAAIAAGAVGGFIDLSVVEMPGTSTVTRWLRSQAVPSDNWLSELARVPYDLAVDEELDLSPAYHRIQTLGHDPLLGLFFGTRDILSGTLTGVRPDGTIGIIDRGGVAVDHWPAALGLHLLHLLSDAFTWSGLPLPGMGSLAAVPGWLTPNARNLAQVAYGRGYNTWHLFTMSSVPAAVEMVCHSYWQMRRTLDEEFAEHVGSAPEQGDHPRWQALTLIAHGVSAGIDLTTAHLTGGGLLAANYAQWVSLAMKAADLASTYAARSPSAELIAQAQRNADALDTGWLCLAEMRGARTDEPWHGP